MGPGICVPGRLPLDEKQVLDVLEASMGPGICVPGRMNTDTNTVPTSELLQWGRASVCPEGCPTGNMSCPGW